jgi:hypothetical protein
VAIHYYGATEAEKQELELAAQRDEEMEKHGHLADGDEKGGIAREVEVGKGKA